MMPRTAALIANPRHPHQTTAMAAMAAGLKCHGIAPRLVDQPTAGVDFECFWGQPWPVSIFDRPRLCLEAGYINGHSGHYVADRLRFISVGWNGIHGYADALPLDFDTVRWQSFGVDLQPWQFKKDGFYLVIEQHPNDKVAPPPDWYKPHCVTLRSRGNRVRRRPHPLVMAGEPFATALATTVAVLAFTSTAAVDAVIAGVPAIVLGRGSMAWPVASHSVDNGLNRPDRGQWAANLAHRQWTTAEMANGTAWDSIRYGFKA